MDLLYFIVMFSCLGVVAHWFIQNDQSQGQGHRGVLGLRAEGGSNSDDGLEGGPRYRMRAAKTDPVPTLSERDRVRQAAQSVGPSREKKYRAGSRETFKVRPRSVPQRATRNIPEKS